MKILLIDGHKLFREGLRHILQQLFDGVDEIFEAGSFREGLEMAGKYPDLDLVLIELKVPGSGGAISIREFRLRCPHIPVVVVSGEEDGRAIKEVMNAGADGFVSKGSDGLTLLSALSLVLKGCIYVPPQLLHQTDMTTERRNNRVARRRLNANDVLTARQQKILSLIANGLSNKEVAERIHISEGTVKGHLANIFRILRVKSRMEATKIAGQLGLINMLDDAPDKLNHIPVMLPKGDNPVMDRDSLLQG